MLGPANGLSNYLALEKIYCMLIPSLRSKRFLVRFVYKAGTRAKKKWMMGEGEGKEGTACPQTPQFWKTAFAHERSFWLARCR